MENNLDNFFKKKLDNREFEMEDAYWADMEQMIEAEEKGNDRKFFWAWLLGGLLLVMLVGGYFWNTGSRSTVSVDQTITNTNIAVVKEQTQTQEATNLLEAKEMNPAEATTYNNVNTTVAASQNADSNNTAEVAKTDASSIREKQQPKNTVSNDSKINDIKASTIKPYSTSSNNNEVVEKKVSSETTIYPTIYLPKENKSEGLLNPKEVMPNSSKPIQKLEPTPLPNQKIEKEQNKVVVKKPVASVLNIASLDILAQINQEENLPDLAWMNMKKKRFSMGITAGIASFPFEQDSIKSTTGYKVGLTARYKLKRNLALNADLIYLYRGGEYNPIQDGEEVTYSFGRSTDRYELTPNSLHYLEMPVYLTYTKKKHIFEGGISVNYLLGVKGVRVKIPNEGPSFATGNPYWLENPGYKKINTNVALGYRYQISPNLHFGVRGVYALGSLMEESGSAINGPERVDLSTNSRLHLNFKLTQYLF